MSIENRITQEEYEPLNQPERIDKAQQAIMDIRQQLGPVGVSNKEEIRSALLALDFMLADAYDEVMERQVFPPDELAEEAYQAALSTLEHYIRRHRKEPEPDVDVNHTSDADFLN
jgi:hypothetical protein